MGRKGGEEGWKNWFSEVFEDGHEGSREASTDGQGDQPGQHDVAEDAPVYILLRSEPAHEHHRTNLGWGCLRLDEFLI